MKYLRVTVRPTERDIHPVHTLMTEREFIERVQTLHWNLADLDLPALFFLVEGDADRFADALAATDAVESFGVTPIDDERFYCYSQGETTDVERALYTTFTRDGLVVLPPLTYDDAGGVTFDVVGEPDELRTALADIPTGIDVDIERVGEYDADRQSAAAALTERQREAVDAAKRLGYYAVPREATVADVAAELSCARSTAAEHLQKAEARLVETVL